MRDGTVPKKLFKYLSYREEFFEELLLRVTPFGEFNDPFEGLLTKDSYTHFLKNGLVGTDKEREEATKIVNDGWEKIAADIKMDDWGIICFAENCDCLLMWAHYANSHKGILIELDTIGSGNAIHPFFEKEIDAKYPPNQLKTDIKPVFYPTDSKRVCIASVPKANLTMKLLCHSKIHSALFKSKEWAYEKEHRMFLNYAKLANIITKEKMHFIRIPEEVISKIYIGCRAENKDEIINNFTEAKKAKPKLEHVKLFESVLDETDFKVNYEEIKV